MIKYTVTRTNYAFSSVVAQRIIVLANTEDTNMAYYDKLKIQSSWFKLIQSIFVLQAELKISLHLRRYTVFLFPTGVKSERNHKIICITGNGFYADDQTLSPTILLRATFSNQGMKLYRRERAGKTYVSPISEASANARNVRFSNTLSRRE